MMALGMDVCNTISVQICQQVSISQTACGYALALLLANEADVSKPSSETRVQGHTERAICSICESVCMAASTYQFSDLLAQGIMMTVVLTCSTSVVRQAISVS